MGYRTVQKIPMVHTYARAKQVHDENKPIRGNPNNVRPLGDRKDWQSYSVRMNGEAVEFVCYKTPVVTYYPDNTIEVRTGGWDTVSTRQFIYHALGLSCRGQSRKTVITVDGALVVMGDAPLKLKSVDYTLVLAQTAPTLYGYKIDRKAANNVRARYKKFYDYFKGFVRLRATTMVNYGNEYERVSATVGELIDAVGVSKKHGDVHYIPDVHKFRAITRRPPEVHPHWRKADKVDEIYERIGNEFMQLLASDDHVAHYKAAMIVMGYDTNMWVRIDELETERSRTFAVDAAAMMTRLDNIVMRWHAKEVLVREALALGKAPNPKYEDWFDKE